MMDALDCNDKFSTFPDMTTTAVLRCGEGTTVNNNMKEEAKETAPDEAVANCEFYPPPPRLFMIVKTLAAAFVLSLAEGASPAGCNGALDVIAGEGVCNGRAGEARQLDR